MNRRFKLLLIFAILFETVTLSQSVQELEAELKNKPISNAIKTRKIAKELLKVDKYNETGILYVVATFYPLEDSIKAFFENLIKSDSENPIPYILRAKYENFNQHSPDSDNVTLLKKAYQLDNNNREANHLLGLAYYSMFIDTESRGKKFYAENSKEFLLNLYNLDKYSINETRYPLAQISRYLNDNLIVQNNEHCDSTQEIFFPLKLFVNFHEGWETDFKFNVIQVVDRGKSYIEWYSKHLKALQEPILFNQSTEKQIFRFTWLRSFHNPIAIRLEKRNDNVILYWKLCNGAGGYEPGELIINRSKELSSKEWNEFNSMIKQSSFWTSKSVVNEILGTDGAQWILEGINMGNYQVVDRWTPSENDFKKCCLYLLNMTDLNIPKREIY